MRLPRRNREPAPPPPAPVPLPITCELCGAAIGSVLPPTLDSVREQLAGDSTVAGSMARSLVVSLPADAAVTVVKLFRFRCPLHP